MDPRVYRGGVEKEREPDADVRRALLETILLFCSTRDCREVRAVLVHAFVRGVLRVPRCRGVLMGAGPTCLEPWRGT
jgi:hypothetical protein